MEDEEVRILAGLKATGRAGATRFGGLVVRTREEEDVAPATTMAVARASRDVLGESRLGVLATTGDPLGRSGSWQLGADFTYRSSRFAGDKNVVAGAWALWTGRDDLASSEERSAFGFKLGYPNDLWDCQAVFRRIGDGFDPSLGFVPRRGIQYWGAGCTFAPRPEDSFIRQMFHELYAELVTDLRGRRESYEAFAAPLDWQLESGDRFELNAAAAGERLVEPFEVADGVVAAPGSYDWRRYGIEVESARKRALSGEVIWSFGGFYGGTLHEVAVEASWTPSRLVTLLATAQRDIGRLPAGDFDLTLLGLKVRLNVSPDLQLDTFVQRDTEEGSLGSNTRLRWTFHPRGDLFMIYDHNLLDTDEGWRRDTNALLVKVQYTFRR